MAILGYTTASVPRHEIDVAMTSRLTQASALAGVREITASSRIVHPWRDWVYYFCAQYPQLQYSDDMMVGF